MTTPLPTQPEEDKNAVRGSFQDSWDEWYWSYGYASKAACIRYVQNCKDITEDERAKVIAYHESNLGVTKDV